MELWKGARFVWPSQAKVKHSFSQIQVKHGSGFCTQQQASLPITRHRRSNQIAPSASVVRKQSLAAIDAELKLLSIQLYTLKKIKAGRNTHTHTHSEWMEINRSPAILPCWTKLRAMFPNILCYWQSWQEGSKFWVKMICIHHSSYYMLKLSSTWVSHFHSPFHKPQARKDGILPTQILLIKYLY